LNAAQATLRSQDAVIADREGSLRDSVAYIRALESSMNSLANQSLAAAAGVPGPKKGSVAPSNISNNETSANGSSTASGTDDLQLHIANGNTIALSQ
jgi:hypothetical protein